MALSCAMPVLYQTPTMTGRSETFFDLKTVKRETFPSGQEMTGHSLADEDIKQPLFKSWTSEHLGSTSDQLTSWTKLHPQHWSKDEVLDWVFYVVDQLQLDGSQVRGEAFQSINGNTLCHMNRDDFNRVDPQYGSKFFEVFTRQTGVGKGTLQDPATLRDSTPSLDSFNQHHHNYNSRFGRDFRNNISFSISLNAKALKTGARNGCDSSIITNIEVNGPENDIKVGLDGLGVYPICTDFEFPTSSSSSSSSLLSPSSSPWCSTPSSLSAYAAATSRIQCAASFTTPPDQILPRPSSSLPQFNTIIPSPYSPTSPATSSSSSSSSSSSLSFSSTSPMSSSTLLTVPSSSRLSSSSFGSMSSLSSPTRRVHVTSSVASSTTSPISSPNRLLSVTSETVDSDYNSDESVSVPPFMPPCLPDDLGTCRDVVMRDDPVLQTGNSRKKKTNKGNHLWEFILDLLKDPNTNPRLLKWEDKENGVFRFVQSEAVARLWGEKKNNPLMTYEKLSRAMRFCRTTGYFDTIPRTGRFPKKLCFMFGAKAHGWND